MAKKRKRSNLGKVVLNATALKNHVMRVCGGNYFDKATMRFFQSRLSSKVHPAGVEDATYFVTSEKGPSGGRRYSVRRLKGCAVDTVGEFQAYRSPNTAHAAAKRFAAAGRAPDGLSGRKKRR